MHPSVFNSNLVEFGDGFLRTSAPTASSESFGFSFDGDAFEDGVGLVGGEGLRPRALRDVLKDMIWIRLVDVEQLGRIGWTSAPTLKTDWGSDRDFDRGVGRCGHSRKTKLEK